MNMTGVLIALAAQAVVTVFLVAWTRRRVRQVLGADDEIERIRREIGSLIVELDSSADRNVTILEDRLITLRQLLTEADKRIAVFGQERPRRQADPAVYDRQGRLHNSKRGIEDAQNQLPAKPLEEPLTVPDVPFIRFTEKPLPIEEPFADQVLSLYRRGFSSDIIAARLAVTMAEVDLVISLEQERKTKSEES